METVGDILLKARGLAVGYRSAGRRVSAVLENIDVDLRAGEVVCLLGANGAGKSTLLRTLAREQQPLSGHVMVDGRDIHHDGGRVGPYGQCCIHRAYPCRSFDGR